jgi:methionyl-tRNA synthetase
VVERNNSDLANVLGNLVNRTISMSNKYFGGIVENKNVTEDVDKDLISVAEQTPGKVVEKMDKLIDSGGTFSGAGRNGICYDDKTGHAGNAA